MKKVYAVFFVLLILTTIVLPVAATGTDSDSGNGSYGTYSIDATDSVLGSSDITGNAKTAVVYELSSDTMMYMMNPDEPIEPASLVKMMTCLIAVEEGNLADAVTVKEDVISSIPEDAANVSLKADEVLTLEQLLYCMMVSSANDAAAVIADHVAGSQEAFVAKMNTYAERIGCVNTHFTNVHGLYDRAQYSTARDMAKILKVAIENELFMQFFCESYYEIPETNKSGLRYLLTGNYLLSTDDVEIYYDARVTGGRTGVTQDYSRNVAVSAEGGNMSVICVITGAASEVASNGYLISVFGGYQEISMLLDICFNDYYVAQVIYDGQVVTQQPVTNGDCDVVLGARENSFAVVPQSTKMSDLTYSMVGKDAFVAPIEKGQLVTTVDIWHNSVCVAQTNLYAMNTVREQQQLTSTGTNPDTSDNKNSSVFWTILLVIVLIVIAVVFIPRVITAVQKRAMINQIRRNSRNRRKSR